MHSRLAVAEENLPIINVSVCGPLAQLSCYAEFNRMVQAIARSAGETGFQRVPGARLV